MISGIPIILIILNHSASCDSSNGIVVLLNLNMHIENIKKSGAWEGAKCTPP